MSALAPCYIHGVVMIFCEAFQMKGGHKHDCTLMAHHKGDHECLCGRWASVPVPAPISIDARTGEKVDKALENIFG